MCSVLACPVLAQELAQDRQTHDLRPVNNGYEVSGPDPYFVVNASDPILSYSQNGRRLAVNLSISNPLVNEAAPSIELFYRLSHDHEPLFDPYQRLKLSLPDTPNQGFELELPVGLTLDPGSRLRIDINGCSTCTLTPLSRPQTAPLIAKLEQAYLGRTELADDGYSIGFTGWHLNDLQPTNPQNHRDQLMALQIIGGDPYFVSPALNVGTGNLGGILFAFKVNEAVSDTHDFQLFYATEKHRFIEPASSIIRTRATDGELQFLLPLTFLNSEFPPAQTLERVRLDITSHSVVRGNQTLNGTWKLTKAQLVSKMQLGQLKDLVPATLVNSKLQRQNRHQALHNIIVKLSRDWLFLITYLLLLLTLSVGLWRKLRDK